MFDCLDPSYSSLYAIFKLSFAKEVQGSDSVWKKWYSINPMLSMRLVTLEPIGMRLATVYPIGTSWTYTQHWSYIVYQVYDQEFAVQQDQSIDTGVKGNTG